MLTGCTILDGPETIPNQCCREIGTTVTSGGYTMRRWEFYPQFHNIHIDIFRKILDGTIRILNRKEVIDRTKVVIVHDVNSGDDRDKYTGPETLYEGSTGWMMMATCWRIEVGLKKRDVIQQFLSFIS